jgi:hypothetical protein
LGRRIVGRERGVKELGIEHSDCVVVAGGGLIIVSCGI